MSIVNRILSYFLLSAVFLSLSFSRIASAHPVAQGSIDISTSPSAVVLTMRASLEQVSVERSFAADVSDETPIGDQWNAHARYVLSHMTVEADGVRLSGVGTENSSPRQEQAFVVFSFTYPLPQGATPRNITVSQNVLNEFDFAPGNPWEATYVVTRNGSSDAAHLLTPRAPLSLSLDGATRSLFALFREFLMHGVHHILEGVDHMLFASALVLSAAVFWDVVKVIATFTIAHTMTLALASLDLVRVPSSIVEPLIALSIVVVSVVTLFRPASSSMRLTLPLAFFFGLFHGLGFAGGLVEAMGALPMTQFWTALAGFSIGVEIGHQLVVIPLFLVIVAIRTFDRQRHFRWTPRFVSACSLVISIGGVFFLINALRG